MLYDTWQPTLSLGQEALTTPGSTKAQGSYWSELSGIYGIVTTINALAKHHGQSQGSILIMCDSEAALTKCMQPWMSNPLEKQFNIIHAIQVGLHATKIKWTSKHIRGHQNKAELALSDKARWNNAMDHSAKQHWTYIQTSPNQSINSLLGKLWELWINNKKVSTNVKCQLLDQTSRHIAWQYWSNKTHFCGMDIKSIDWQTIQTVVTGMTITQYCWTTKFTTGFCTMGCMMHQCEKHTSAVYPYCGYKQETMAHILQCPARPCSTSNWRPKHLRTMHTFKRFRNQPSSNQRP